MKFSQRSSKEFLKSQAVSKRRRKKKIYKIYLMFFLVVLGMVLFVMFTRMERFLIRNVVVTGHITLSESEVEEYVKGIISSNYFFLIPKNNAFLYPKSKIVTDLQRKFLRIGEVSMSTESFEYLNVKIKERDPVAMWCNPIECFLLDENGYAFAEEDTLAQDINKENLLVIRGMDEMIGSQPVGRHILSSEKMANFFEIKDVLDSFNLSASELEYRSVDEIIFRISGSGRIILSNRTDPKDALNNLKSVLDSKVLADKMKDLEYIDVRFGNKVFYKIRRGEVESLANTPADSSDRVSTTTSTQVLDDEVTESEGDVD